MRTAVAQLSIAIALLAISHSADAFTAPAVIALRGPSRMAVRRSVQPTKSAALRLTRNTPYGGGRPKAHCHVACVRASEVSTCDLH